MKKYIVGIICVFVVCAVFGVSMKSTYTDLTAKDGYMMTMNVAELPEELAGNICDTMRELLPDSSYIIRVRGTGEERKIFHLFMQKVEIVDVIQAEEELLSAGEKIYITKSGWRYYFDLMAMDYGFVNKMQEGKEYLVFLDSRKDTTLDRTVDLEVYDLGEYIVDPIFCYEELERVVAAVSGESTYVPYREVCENEFFACTDTAMDELLQLKADMMEKYPKK